MAMEFLVRGAVDHGEPGVFVTFEETEQELKDNVASLGFDLDDLMRRKKLAVEFVVVERHDIEETGDYDLEGALHPPRRGDPRDRREASRARHDRGDLRGPVERGDSARRVAAVVPVAEGPRHHDDRDR